MKIINVRVKCSRDNRTATWTCSETGAYAREAVSVGMGRQVVVLAGGGVETRLE